MNLNLIPIDIEKLKESAKKESTNGYRAKIKLAILTRDNFKCSICDKTVNLTIAHIIPSSKYKEVFKHYVHLAGFYDYIHLPGIQLLSHD